MAEWQARGGHLAAALPQGAFRFIALDVETACGDAASICQIGLACVREGGAIETYATYVDPQMRFSGFNTQLHGIGAEHVAGAPLFGEALARLAPLLSRGHGLAHLKRQLGLSFEHHDAGEDARAAATVVLQAEARLGMSFDQILNQPGRRAPEPIYPVSDLIE